MYKCLSISEKKNMFKYISIKINKKYAGSKNPLIVSLHGVKDKKSYNYEILSFSKFNSNNGRVLITDLRKSESDIDSLHAIFSAVCEEIIKKFIKLTAENKHKRLSIFTKDPTIQEILLENKFSLVKSSANVGVVATLNV